MFSLLFAPYLFGFLLFLLSFKRLSVAFVQSVTIITVFFSFCVSILLFYNAVILGNTINDKVLDWIVLSDFTASWGIYVDSVTASMLLVITGVSTLVHVYSVGYMSHDPHPKRFMVYLSLFTFFMVILVTANNFLQMFVGWEGVGLSSYLLIGFWFNKDSANKASIKAFVTNRVGDLALIVAMCAIYFYFGTLNFKEVFANVDRILDLNIVFLGFSCRVIDFICVAIFLGCMGKSAQIGLHVWLPDAMEGPTPVSALIHAATMVTAGVFLVVRCSYLFEYSSVALGMITIVGAVTAIFAATIAITQTDIKKIIAYSTCSQLGYMFFACGTSAYETAMFHLVTHAFFKALLFLSAGAVIHALHDEQNIMNMGGLAKKIPFTFACFIIGSVAIAGIFPFAGYYSKDAILEAAFMTPNLYGKFAYVVGILSAFLTSFYSWRLIILVFNGKTRLSHEVYDHAHDASFSMSLPLAILAIMSVISGVVCYYIFGVVAAESTYWRGAIFHIERIVVGSQHGGVHGVGGNILELIHHAPLWVKYLPLVVSVAAISLAYYVFLKRNEIAEMFKENAFLRIFYNLSSNKYYIDEIYDFVLVKPVFFFSWITSRFVDKLVIDAMIPHFGMLVARIGSVASGLVHAGNLQKYLVLNIGFVVLLLFFVIGLYL